MYHPENNRPSGYGGRKNSFNINKVLCVSLIAVMMLECILVLLPVVEVESTLLGQTWSFALNDLLGDNLVIAAIIVLHIVSILLVAIPVLTRRKVEGMNYILAYATTILTLLISAVLAINIDKLLMDTLLGGIMSIASIEVSAVFMYIMVALSLAGVGLSFGSMATAGD